MNVNMKKECIENCKKVHAYMKHVLLVSDEHQLLIGVEDEDEEDMSTAVKNIKAEEANHTWKNIILVWLCHFFLLLLLLFFIFLNMLTVIKKNLTKNFL